MAKNKPLKRHKALVELSRDHHSGLLFCWKLRKGFTSQISGERMAAYAGYFFDEHLKEHFLLEERLIFPLLPKENDLRQEAERQHQKLYELINQIKEKKAISLLKELEQKLEKHIRFEERQLFMHIQESLEEAELLALQARVEGVHVKKAEQWKDIFWN